MDSLCDKPHWQGWPESRNDVALLAKSEKKWGPAHTNMRGAGQGPRATEGSLAPLSKSDHLHHDMARLHMGDFKLDELLKGLLPAVVKGPYDRGSCA